LGHDAVLQCVLDSPNHPHSSNIVVGHMTMGQEVAHTLLTTAAAALVFHIVIFRWPHGLGVYPGGCFRQQGRKLVQAGVEVGRFNTRLPPPPYRSAVDVVHMKHL